VRGARWPAAFPIGGEGASAINKAIADIEASTDAPTLVDLKEFIDRASTSGDTSTNVKKGKP
jgi:hypothetical protein